MNVTSCLCSMQFRIIVSEYSANLEGRIYEAERFLSEAHKVKHTFFCLYIFGHSWGQTEKSRFRTHTRTYTQNAQIPPKKRAKNKCKKNKKTQF